MIVHDSIMYRCFNHPYPTTFMQEVREEEAYESYRKKRDIFNRNVQDLLEYLKYIEDTFNESMGGLTIHVRCDWYIRNEFPIIDVVFKNKNWDCRIPFSYYDVEREDFGDRARWDIRIGIIELITGTLGFDKL